jgi:hypothetical protein
MTSIWITQFIIAEVTVAPQPLQTKTAAATLTNAHINTPTSIPAVSHKTYGMLFHKYMKIFI